MVAKYLTPHKLHVKGFEVLLRELGPADTSRFMQQFEMGHGDYSKDRHQWLDQFTVEDIAKMASEKKTTQKKKK